MSKPSPSLSLGYGAVLVTAAVLYWASCAPGLLWQDSGLIQYRVINNEVEGFLGLALSHPLFYLLAICTKAIPWWQVPYKVNLLAALAAAIAVANVFLLIRLWTGRALAGLVGAASLAISHTFWQHASMAETYTLWAALFTAELLVLLLYSRTGGTRYLYSLGLLNGLAAAVHMLAVIPLAVYLVYTGLLHRRRAIAGRDLGVMVLLWMVGSLPFEYLVCRHALASGDILGTLSSALFGDHWRGAVLNATISARIFGENLLLWLLNFPTPNAALAAVGAYAVIRSCRRDAFARMLAAMTILFLVFAFRYTVPDRYAFFIPFYGLVSVLIGGGAGAVLAKFHSRWLQGAMVAAALLPVGFYAAAPWLAQKAGVTIHTRGDVPYRNDLEYFLRPWKTGYMGAERFATEALTAADPNAVVYADLTTVGPLWITQQTAGLRPDVTVISAGLHRLSSPVLNAGTLAGLLRARPVYVVSRKNGTCPAFVLEEYDLVRVGCLWQVKIRRS